MPNSQVIRLQLTHNSVARAVVKAIKFSHSTTILKAVQSP